VDEDWMTIGAVSRRTGVAPSALRFYESQGLITSSRADSGHRRYHRSVLRRVSFIRVAQQVGLSLGEIAAALASLPQGRTPTKRDWERLSSAWGPRIDEQIALLQRLRDRLTGCIGCGCLSMKACHLLNPGDELAGRGSGPRYVVEDAPRPSSA
jgi:MerR family transcriptional regulator, redox-sensitive transcriptional activator SoxR